IPRTFGAFAPPANDVWVMNTASAARARSPSKQGNRGSTVVDAAGRSVSAIGLQSTSPWLVPRSVPVPVPGLRSTVPRFGAWRIASGWAGVALQLLAREAQQRAAGVTDTARE